MSVFLGYPSESVINWIKEHSKNLYFKAVNGDATIRFSSEYWPEGPIGNKDLEYSFDGINWSKWTYSGTEFPAITILNGQKLYMRGNNVDMYGYGPGDACFKMTGQIEAHGNIMYLLSYDGSKTHCPEYCFMNLFYGCSGLLTAPDIPAVSLGMYAYQNMFRECTSLTEAPIIPAFTIDPVNYQYELDSMFNGCSSLNYVEVKFDHWEDDHTATANWLDGVSSVGTFVCPSDLPQIIDSSHIPLGWTIVTK